MGSVALRFLIGGEEGEVLRSRWLIIIVCCATRPDLAADVDASEPTIWRLPNDSMLVEKTQFSDPNVPIVSAQTWHREAYPSAKHYVQLGSRDDRNQADYSVPNRSRETPYFQPTGRYCQNGFERAGCPNLWRWIADYSVQRKHTIGYIGGGSPWHVFGEGRCSNEGTFGMDSTSHWLSRKLWLKWNHGTRYQGGAGAYATDGPRLFEH